MVMSEQDAQGSDNSLLALVIGRHGLGGRNRCFERHVDFPNIYRLTIGGTLFGNRISVTVEK